MTKPKPLNLFMASSAVSGDIQGAHLARKILALRSDVTIVGSGGSRMREAGVQVAVDTEHLGRANYIAALWLQPEMKRVFEEQKRLIHSRRPDLAILIDFDGYFNERMAEHLHRQKIPIIYYFPPLVWLWGAWRARRIARRARAIVTGFPGELDLYRKVGGRAVYFGHPLVDILLQNPVMENRAAGVDGKSWMIGLMPGSRVDEIGLLAPAMLGAAAEIARRHPGTSFFLPVASPHLKPLLKKQIKAQGLEGRIKLGEQSSYAELKQCDVVIVAAGTATIELAVMEIPMVVVYRLGDVTYSVARFLVKTEFIAMPNIQAKRRIVPELRQAEMTVENIVAETLAILENDVLSARIKSGLKEVHQALGGGKVLDQVAEFILAEATVPRLETVAAKPRRST